ncbi:hypothetical protein RPMA_11060 [Tardiphaga alba]|uniref:Uncharacterized protein n=1 Tax=Tardiphaga alba TaxID=340268 RepID=A0ABX8A6Q2_9BRAD|nr:hypothetical protein [Tardiphaga alba]QUS39312.1 hypothetical protein RPMA_11060 [Tardiphaga alba]
MAAGGLGLALLHHQTSEAKATTTDGRNSADVTPAAIDRSANGQPDRPSDEATATHDHRTEFAPSGSDLDAGHRDDPGSQMDSRDTGSLGSEHHDRDARLQDDTNSALETPSGSPFAIGSVSVDHSEPGHAATSGLQNLLSGASSAIADITHGLEQRLDAMTSATSQALDASLSAVTSQVLSLTSHIGDLVAGPGEQLSQTANVATGLAGELVGPATSTAAAVVDPIFHQAFGPANDIHTLAGEVIDTSGLASFGSTIHDAPMAFLGQSYTDVADHTVHGLQGLTHGLV